jgi:predicted component of viral defense system (DUF524 family)
MLARQRVSLTLQDPNGRGVGFIHLSLLPGTKMTAPAPLVEALSEESDEGAARVQILEGNDYRYEFEIPTYTGPISTDRPEVFRPDSYLGTSGRIHPGLFTGTLPVIVFAGGIELGRCDVEVRSRKLDYLSEYRWMLRDIAEYCTELVMERFAPSIQRFVIDDTRDAVTLYERFCFLRSLVIGPDLKGAIGEILRHPHVAWIETHEQVPPGSGVRADSSSVRQLAKGRPRAPWPNGRLSTVPVKVDRRRTYASVDTTPNRFVKFALTRWRQVLADIGLLLEQATQTEAARRGVREVNAVIEELDAWLAAELFRELSHFSRFPADDQVLQKREGYRDVYRAHIQFELAARLSWHGGFDVFGAGKRDVAALYEYWVFLQLAEALSDMLAVQFDFGQLIELDRDGLNVLLKAGKWLVLRGLARRLNRELAVELWFNREFPMGDSETGSWTRSMRPDYSVVVSPSTRELASFEPVVVHFDAKYRVDFIEDLFGGPGEVANEVIDTTGARGLEGEVLRSDLLKMHAYRDAIRRSVGAYVIYPGTRDETFREYHEILPGLGAFPLRPSAGGKADGIETVRRFLADVLDHVALQISQHERGRYWIRQTYAGSEVTDKSAPAAPFLSAPPADTNVLLGFVRHEAHWHWIEKHRLYNLRAGIRRGAVELTSSELACELLILSCPSLRKAAIARVVSQPEIHTQKEMARMDYPDPQGTYFCLRIERLPENEWSRLLSTDLVEDIRSERASIPGAPVAITWRDLVVRASGQ